MFTRVQAMPYFLVNELQVSKPVCGTQQDSTVQWDGRAGPGRGAVTATLGQAGPRGKALASRGVSPNTEGAHVPMASCGLGWVTVIGICRGSCLSV